MAASGRPPGLPPADTNASRPKITVSSNSGPERLVERYVLRESHKPRSRFSSGGSSSIHSPNTSSGSHDYSSASSEGSSYVDVGYGEDDGIEPSDSASRSRQPTSSRRHTTEAPSAPRRSSRATGLREEIIDVGETRRPRASSSRHTSTHHRRSDSHQAPSDESVSVADDYPYHSHHGAPQPPSRGAYPPNPGYRHVPGPSHGGYTPSMTSSSQYNQYAPQPQALVHQPHFGYQQSNPFDPNLLQRGENPFSPISPQGSAAGTSYFATDPMAPPMPQHRPQGPTRPQSFAATSQYVGSELVSQYGPSGMFPGYGGYAMPPPWAHYGPPVDHRSPSPKDDKKEQTSNTTSAEIESLKVLIRQQEEARINAEKARIEEIKAAAAAAAAKMAQEEAERKKKEEIADASKKAKEEAEKKAAEAATKAKEEHDKKMAEAQKAKEELEKKHKELEAANEKLKPAPDSTKSPIRFKDAVGRKFSFPWHICKTWKGMEGLIKQAFLHVDVIGEHVHQGHYDLTGPDGEIILPQVWDTMVQPDWEITMHMWPMPEDHPKEDRLAADTLLYDDEVLNFLDMGSGLPKSKKTRGSGKSGSGKKKDKVAEMYGPGAPGLPPVPPPPPGMARGGAMHDPRGVFIPMGPIAGDPKKPGRTKSKSKSSISPFAKWVTGASTTTKPARRSK